MDVVSVSVVYRSCRGKLWRSMQRGRAEGCVVDMWMKWHCTYIELVLAGWWNVKLLANPILTKAKEYPLAFSKAWNWKCNAAS